MGSSACRVAPDTPCNPNSSESWSAGSCRSSSSCLCAVPRIEVSRHWDEAEVVTATALDTSGSSTSSGGQLSTPGWAVRRGSTAGEKSNSKRRGSSKCDCTHREPLRSSAILLSMSRARHCQAPTYGRPVTLFS
eukprot:EG_transcript_7053